MMEGIATILFSADVTDHAGEGKIMVLSLYGSDKTCEKLGLDGGHLPDSGFYDPKSEPVSTAQTDIFSVASVIYTIPTGHWPYRSPGPFRTGEEMEEYRQRVDHLFEQGHFPDVAGLFAGEVIMKCWRNEYANADDVLQELRSGMMRETSDVQSCNMIIDSQHNVLSVIDRENAFVVPWEMVEFAKELSIVPPAMDGQLYDEIEARLRLAERRKYIGLTRQAETAHGLDNCLSTTLEDLDLQHFAHAMWLHADRRIGLHTGDLDEFEESRNCRR
ncbi:Putative serine/threonine-protein kinase gdt2 [Tolypocladium paradoxum]|uniref:Serine/threonine-protein kinase gdt2 n=1 Tax=Tolypocladium paradoxum TaxID=94208 RepID=A0A2S4L521_9HYPO|nr:Putative serine/threonine-protein kinase gdt2 [Tolypocladium paradoxum]